MSGNLLCSRNLCVPKLLDISFYYSTAELGIVAKLMEPRKEP